MGDLSIDPMYDVSLLLDGEGPETRVPQDNANESLGLQPFPSLQVSESWLRWAPDILFCQGMHP
jgi:hypothetical protein